jgi:hypothetical protein
MSAPDKGANHTLGEGCHQGKSLTSEDDVAIRSKALTPLKGAVKNAQMALYVATESLARDKSEVIGKLLFQLNYLYSVMSGHPKGRAQLLEAAKVQEKEAHKLGDHDFVLIGLVEEVEIKGKELLELAMRGDYDSITKVIEELQNTMVRIEEMISSREETLREM